MKHFAIFAPAHELDDPFGGQLFDCLEFWTSVGSFNWDVVCVNFDAFVFYFDAFLELLQAVFFQCKVVFLPCILVRRLHLANSLEVFNSKIKLTKRDISRAAAEVGLDIGFIVLDRVL